MPSLKSALFFATLSVSSLAFASEKGEETKLSPHAKIVQKTYKETRKGTGAEKAVKAGKKLVGFCLQMGDFQYECTTKTTSCEETTGWLGGKTVKPKVSETVEEIFRCPVCVTEITLGFHPQSYFHLIFGHLMNEHQWRVSTNQYYGGSSLPNFMYQAKIPDLASESRQVTQP